MSLTQQRIVLHAQTVYAAASSVEDSIDGIEVAGLHSGAQVYSDDIEKTFTYDAASAAAPVLNTIIAPLNGVGRWVLDASGSISVPGYFTVGTNGDVDYTSIAAAIAAAIAAGATILNPYEILVYPGTYTEPPMPLPPGVTVTTEVADPADLVYVVAQQAAQDLFTCTGGTLCGLRLEGVTDPMRCLIRIDGAGVQVSMRGVSIRRCSTGIVVSGGARGYFGNLNCKLNAAGIGVTELIHAEGANTRVSVVNANVFVPPTLPPLYATNPIQTVVRATDQARVYVSNALLEVAPKDATADIIFADETSRVVVVGGEIRNSGNGLHVGSTGANTVIAANGTFFDNNTLNGWNESATGMIFLSVTIGQSNYTGVAGSKLLGFVQDLNLEIQTILSGTDFRYVDQGTYLNLDDYFNDFTSTGTCESFTVTDAGGLTVNVSAGEGFISRLTEEDAFWVSWVQHLGLALANNTTNYVVYDSTTDDIVAQLGTASQTQILLATVVTAGGDIIYLHTTYVPVERVQQNLDTYFRATRRVAWNTGLALIQGSTARQITVGGGSYYIAMTLLPYAGAADSLFNYIYGPGGASLVVGTALLDITNYDNAGALAAMTPTWFRMDAVVLTSDGRLSIIYGTVENAVDTVIEALPFPLIPNYLEPTACPIARIIVQQGVGIHAIYDARPVATWTSGSSSGAPIGVHSALAGLVAPADDHTQYLLTNGGRALTGDLDVGGNNVVNVGTVDGVDVSAHAARHAVGGLDPLATGNPVAILVGAAVDPGAAPEFAQRDHQHGLPTGNPVAIGDANAPGASSEGNRRDHVHDHGTHAVSNQHAVADDTINGFVTALPGAGTPFTILLSADGQNQAWGAITDDYINDVDWAKITGTPTTLAGYGILDGALAATTMTAGAGLTGGGDLSANRTFNVVANADGSIIVNANDIQVGVLANDGQHGARGGGTQHAVATGATEGFESAADKTKLDGIRALATSAILHCGNDTLNSSTTTRYLTPGYSSASAGTTAIQYRVPFAGTFKNLRVRHNTTAGNGNAIVYTLRVNGVASVLTVSMASTASDGSDLAHTMAVAAGDLIDIVVTKALSVGTSPGLVVASLEVSA